MHVNAIYIPDKSRLLQLCNFCRDHSICLQVFLIIVLKMVRAWHIKNPSKFLTLEEVFKLSGVQHRKVDVNNLDTDETLQKVRKDGGYKYEDIMLISGKEPDFEGKMKKFHTEHLHTNEETRLCLDGLAYFEVRDKNDDWIKVEFEPGDLLILPPGIYHRLSLDEKKYVKIRRLFLDSPVWVAHDRPADDLECRQQYLAQAIKGF